MSNPSGNRGGASGAPNESGGDQSALSLLVNAADSSRDGRGQQQHPGGSAQGGPDPRLAELSRLRAAAGLGGGGGGGGGKQQQAAARQLP